MIVDTKRERLLITPPRTASRALHQWLAGEHGWTKVIHPYFGHHSPIVYNEYRQYKQMIVVRHPKDRVMSLYLMMIENNREFRTLDVTQYLRRAAAGKFGWAHRLTCRAYHRRADEAQPIYYEHLAAELALHDIPAAGMPLVGASPRVWHSWTDEQLQILAGYQGEDAAQYYDGVLI